MVDEACSGCVSRDAREARETFGPTPSLIAPHQRSRFVPPASVVGVLVKRFFRNTFARFVSRFVILHRVAAAPVPGDDARGQGGRRARPVLPPHSPRRGRRSRRCSAAAPRRALAPDAAEPRGRRCADSPLSPSPASPRSPARPAGARARRAASGAPASTRRRPWTTSPPPRWPDGAGARAGGAGGLDVATPARAAPTPSRGARRGASPRGG